MFKLSAIRDLNQVALYYGDKKRPTELVFRAYILDGYNFGLNIKVEDAFGSFKGITDNAFVMSMVNTLVRRGLNRPETAVLDIPMKATYMGSSQIPFNIECSLFVINDFDTDIVQPVNNLKHFLLPGNSEDFNTEELFKKVEDWIVSNKNEAIEDKHTKGNVKFTGGIWELAQKGVSTVKDYVGNVSLMTIPGQFADDAKALTLKLPGLVVPEVYISSVNIKVPYVTYSDKEGRPFIDRVDINLGMNSMRVASRNYIQFLK